MKADCKMHRRINFEDDLLGADADQISLIQEGRPSDQNSLKHENSYSELGGPVWTPKFGKLTLERKRLAHVKNKKI